MNLVTKLDDFGRRHPTLFLIFVLLLTALVAVPALLYNSAGTFVLYQQF